MKRPIQPGIRIGARADAGEDARVAEALREAAAQWPSGVAVLAVRDGEVFEAITLTSFIIVALDPPLVLVSIGRHAAIVSVLEGVGRYGISLLAADQGPAASLVADRLPNVRALFSRDDVPVLDGAITTLVCHTEAVHPAGDHLLYIAAVEQVIAGPDSPPLLYHRRRYRRLEAR